MGSGYTVEGQVTGEEKFGGIQIEVTPSYRKRDCVFWYMGENGRPWKTAIPEYSTPRGQSLKEGSTIYMELPRSRPAELSDFFESREQLAEIDCLALNAIMPAPEIIAFEDHDAGEYSWDAGESELLQLATARRSREAPHDTSTSCQTQLELMGLAAGGKLIQDLVVDRNPPYIWNTSRTRLINLHIFSPASFEAVTHIVPPGTPITARAYADAGLPFFVVEEDAENRLDGSVTLDAVKSVSQMDKQVGVDDCGAPSLDIKTPKRCGVCKIRLCDCMCVIPPGSILLFSLRSDEFLAQVYDPVTTNSASLVSKWPKRCPDSSRVVPPKGVAQRL